MARRSNISSIWRTNIDMSPEDSVNDSAHSTLHTPPDRIIPQEGNTRSTDVNPINASTGSQETVRGENDPETLRAIAEDRRLYVGNMPYFAKANDVQHIFEKDGYEVVHLNMSIDPYTGRNPSYCFVELKTKEEADRAMRGLNGKDLLGRPVKIGPGIARSSAKHPRAQQDQGHRSRARPTPVFNRWTRIDAADHWTGYSEQGRRLWVGGLPRMDDHLTVNNGVRELFKGFKLEAISKVIIPASPAFGAAGAWNHRYLFVDFSTAEEAHCAARATNGKQAWGVKIRVQLAKPPESRKIGERVVWQEEEKLARMEG